MWCTDPPKVRTMKTRRKLTMMTVVIAASLALVAGACSSDDDSTASSKDTTGATDTVDDTETNQSRGSSCVDSVEDSEGFAAEATDRGEPALDVVDVPDELVIVDDVVGTGCEVEAGALVTVQYSGAAASTGVVFDSSWARGEAAQFPLDGVIEGWSKGLLGMRSGGRRTLVIPAEMAYGDGGPAPGDALVFVVDLIGVQG